MLEDKGADALGIVPFRRQAVHEIAEEIERRLQVLAGDRPMRRRVAGRGGPGVSRTLSIDDGRIQRELILVGARRSWVAIPNARSAMRIRGCRGGTPSSVSRPTACGCAISAAGTARSVNGRPIAEAMLIPGDTVQIAHLTIQFNDASASATVHVGRGARTAGGPPAAAAPPVEDDRTRVVSPADIAAARPPPPSGCRCRIWTTAHD